LYLLNLQQLVNQGNAQSIQIATLINDSLPPPLAISIGGNSAPPNGYTANTSDIIARLQNPATIASVMKWEINLLTVQDIPAVYKILVTGNGGQGNIYTYKDANGNSIYADINKFRILCKQYVYRARDPAYANITQLECLLFPSSNKAFAETAVAILLDYSAAIAITQGTTFYNNIP
jgi:hypothetical protein